MSALIWTVFNNINSNTSDIVPILIMLNINNNYNDIN